MREACTDVQASALELRNITDPAFTKSLARGTSPSRTRDSSPGPDSLAVVTISRQLLSAITKVLLLADKLCVKQILTARDNVLYWLQELESVSSKPSTALAEFVATFSELGRALVELAHLSGDRQSDLRIDKDRECLAVSRATLERGTQLLLAAAKTCLRHPESIAAAKVRDSILRMMRQALGNVGQALSDSVTSSNNAKNVIVTQSDSDSSGNTGDSGFSIAGRDRSESNPPLRELVSNVKSLVDGDAFTAGSVAVRRLDAEVNRLADVLQDFTDCAYTSHASRERLLGLLDRLRTECGYISESSSATQQDNERNEEEEGIKSSINRLTDALSFLQSECQRTAEQLAMAALESRSAENTLNSHRKKLSHSSPEIRGDESDRLDDYTTLINQLEFSALAGDQSTFRCSLASFEQKSDLSIESARLLRHIAPNESLQMDAEHILQWLRLISKAISLSAQVSSLHLFQIIKFNFQISFSVFD